MSDIATIKEKDVCPEALSATTSASSHKEKHTGSGLFVRVCIIGFADGLTVPFALTAGLSSLGSSKLVIIGGLAELFAGAISMGLGAYLASTTEQDHYNNEEKRERREIAEQPLAEEEEIYDILAKYGLSRAACKPMVENLKLNEDMWVQVGARIIHSCFNYRELITSLVHDGFRTEAGEAKHLDGLYRGHRDGTFVLPW